jgi:hypothetical protein
LFYETIYNINGKYGFIYENANEIIPPKYDYLSNFRNGFGTYKLNRQYGFIDSNGNEIIPPKYDDLSYFHNGFAKYKLKNKWGLIDKNGIELTKALFKWNDVYNISRHSNNIFWGEHNIIFKNHSIFKNHIKIVL